MKPAEKRAETDDKRNIACALRLSGLRVPCNILNLHDFEAG